MSLFLQELCVYQFIVDIIQLNKTMGEYKLEAANSVKNHTVKENYTITMQLKSFIRHVQFRYA